MLEVEMIKFAKFRMLEERNGMRGLEAEAIQVSGVIHRRNHETPDE